MCVVKRENNNGEKCDTTEALEKRKTTKRKGKRGRVVPILKGRARRLVEKTRKDVLSFSSYLFLPIWSSFSFFHSRLLARSFYQPIPFSLSLPLSHSVYRTENSPSRTLSRFHRLSVRSSLFFFFFIFLQQRFLPFAQTQTHTCALSLSGIRENATGNDFLSLSFTLPHSHSLSLSLFPSFSRLSHAHHFVNNVHIYVFLEILSFSLFTHAV